MRRFIRANIGASFALALLILILMDVVFLSNYARLYETSGFAEHSRRIIAQLERVHLYKEDAESEHLGYLLTGEQVRLDTFRSDIGTVRSTLRDLRSLSQGSPDRLQRVDTLEALIGAGVDQMELVVALRNQRGPAAGAATANLDTLRQTMDDIDDLLLPMQANERELLGSWDLAQQIDARNAALFALLASLLAALLVAVAVLVVHLDAEDLRKARDSQAHLVAILDAAPDFVGMAGPAGESLYLNRAGRAMVGFGRDERLDGLQISELHPAWAAKVVLGLGIPEATSHGSWTGETAILTRDGREIPVSQHILAHRNASGTVEFLSAILRDISQAKETERYLRQAKEAAEAASRAKSEFLAAVSHEIRTPMNVILGVNDLLWESPLSDEQREQLAAARSAGQILLGLISDILDLSSIEAQRLTLEEVEFNLRSLLEQECHVMRRQATRKGIELGWHVAPEVLVGFVGDPKRLQQVLTNLLGNAVKFTEGGEIAVEVGLARGEPGESTPSSPEACLLLFSVRDTGIGIPPQKLATIFDRFTQADAAITRRYGGTGLGLAITKQLLELMGGRIWVESQLGRGSTFYFTLPLRFAAEAPAATAIDGPASTPDSSAPETGADEWALRILLAEDSAQNRWLIESYLKGSPHSVDFAQNGEVALAKYKSAEYDLVLMDVQMPVMDGHHCTRAIRQWEAENGRAPTPIIAVTAYAMLEEIEDSLDAGCDAHLAKPVRKAALLEVLHRFGRRHEAAL